MTWARLASQWRTQEGWGLLECFLSMAMLSLIFAATLTFLLSAQHQYRADRAGGEARDNAQAAFSTLSRLIRSAGNNPHGIPMQPVHIENPGTISIESDLTGGADGLPDGVIDDAFERVTLQWDPVSRQMTLASGGGSRQPLARCISLLEMTGIGADGMPAPTNAEIVYVQVHLKAEGDSPDLRTMLRQEMELYALVPILSRLHWTP